MIENPHVDLDVVPIVLDVLEAKADSDRTAIDVLEAKLDALEAKADSDATAIDALDSKLDTIIDLLKTPQGRRSDWNE